MKALGAQVEYNPNLGYKDEIIQRHIRLVHSIAKQYKHRCNASIGYDDLISEGTIGLIKAFHRFDPEGYGGAPVKFSTYAGSYIRGMIQQLLERHSSSVRTPKAIYYAAAKIMRCKHSSPEEIAKELQMDQKLVNQTLEYLQGGGIRSLDQAVNAELETDLTLLDVLGKDDDQTEMLTEEFAAFLDTREYAIMTLLLRGKGQLEIAEMLNVSQSYTSRLLARIKHKLQSYIQNPESEEWNMSNETRRVRPPVGAVTLLDGVEWYTPETSVSEPSVSINSLGLHINRGAADLLKLQVGDYIQIGVNPKLLRLIIRKGDEGLKLLPTSGKSGAMATNSKALFRWVDHKGVARKRYAVGHDEVTGLYFVQLEKA
ncbi:MULTISPECIES: sigma-70 family RNA polymerase sigma factor [unclassified Paenibacillus]|uniref:sigma-70 family RNA polymerase sigma factor n=1 Tax=unclassified Paenibacillus TaxID=185978 RepID=UPI00247370BD|nr:MULTISPECIES: sigma-70 family RNA polymerase sigma factor [unclassified Paenibacillus]MDH6430263.1 DNA-directed RNA polymerase specialized sigma subunit [Paenibacillus sp. PastH-4]MDH6530056.1 DNA-directed RNA polymerase specialized sigma subunit [Paenibacillus sp. PastH-3]